MRLSVCIMLLFCSLSAVSQISMQEGKFGDEEVKEYPDISMEYRIQKYPKAITAFIGSKEVLSYRYTEGTFSEDPSDGLVGSFKIYEDLEDASNNRRRFMIIYDDKVYINYIDLDSGKSQKTFTVSGDGLILTVIE